MFSCSRKGKEKSAQLQAQIKREIMIIFRPQMDPFQDSHQPEKGEDWYVKSRGLKHLGLKKKGITQTPVNMTRVQE